MPRSSCPVPRSPFPVLRSPFPVLRSPFPVPRSPFPVPRPPSPIPRFIFFVLPNGRDYAMVFPPGTESQTRIQQGCLPDEGILTNTVYKDF